MTKGGLFHKPPFLKTQILRLDLCRTKRCSFYNDRFPAALTLAHLALAIAASLARAAALTFDFLRVALGLVPFCLAHLAL